MTELEQRILDLVNTIPRGKITTYKEIAHALGNSGLARVVGNTLRKNPHIMEIPCHRVVKSNGNVGEYQLGVEKKLQILLNEGISIEGGTITTMEGFLFRFNTIN